MTMTPKLIGEFLTPWVLAAIAVLILFLSVWRLHTSGRRVLAAFTTGHPPYNKHNRRPFTGKDIYSAITLAVTASVLALAIDSVQPGPQWWSQPLTSAWEVSFGFATVVMVAAGALLQFMVGLLALLPAGALLSWLGEPIDADEPDGTNRVQWAHSAAAAWWNTRRARTDQHPTAGGERA
ncbi:hypothetical protein [Mycolicibacterium fortuitum]|uniref:hypothetical protein n=1 Tax=Mycolicibacterium fortuitum TaxID=1766 RepID=UPI003AACE805